MSETHALYILICLAILAAGVIVWHYGKPEVLHVVAETQGRYDVYADTGVFVLTTNDPEIAENARKWHKGKTVDTWQQ